MSVLIPTNALALLQSSGGDAASSIASLVLILVYLLVAAVQLVAMAKIFQKAGKPWWGALVPIYNSYLLLKVAGLSGWWLLGLSVPVINLFVFAFVFHKLAESFGKGIGYTLGLIFVSPIFFPLLAFGGARHQSNAV